MKTTPEKDRDGAAKVHPIHALLGMVPNWFILGTVHQKPHYASWSLTSDTLNLADPDPALSARQSKHGHINRKPIRIHVVKTRFCTYVIER